MRPGLPCHVVAAHGIERLVLAARTSDRVRRSQSPAVMEWVNARLGKTQRLSALSIVDSLPRSAIGKVLKRELRELHAQVHPAQSAGLG